MSDALLVLAFLGTIGFLLYLLIYMLLYYRKSLEAHPPVIYQPAPEHPNEPWRWADPRKAPFRNTLYHLSSEQTPTSSRLHLPYRKKTERAILAAFGYLGLAASFGYAAYLFATLPQTVWTRLSVALFLFVLFGFIPYLFLKSTEQLTMIETTPTTANLQISWGIFLTKKIILQKHPSLALTLRPDSFWNWEDTNDEFISGRMGQVSCAFLIKRPYHRTKRLHLHLDPTAVSWIVGGLASWNQTTSP